MTPFPLVSVRNSPLYPISPLDGMMNSSLVVPLAFVVIFLSSPLRSESLDITAPENSSGTSIIACSTGSRVPPFSSSLYSTSGLLTANSKPSRRIFSIRTER